MWVKIINDWRFGMVSKDNITRQLTKINFNFKTWNRAEVNELKNIILPEEEIFECVNGWYQGGGALLVATNIRVLLIDKKPMQFLAVEDVRFDTIAQIDYGHRFLDAHIGINTGLKELRFRSYNKDRLRNLISHVQRRMAEIKLEQQDHSDSQKRHLKQIDLKLQEYLQAQQIQGESFIKHISGPAINIISNNQALEVPLDTSDKALPSINQNEVGSELKDQTINQNPTQEIYEGYYDNQDLYKAGIKEIYKNINSGEDKYLEDDDRYLFRVAYSKLPMILKNRKKTQEIMTRSTLNVNFDGLNSQS